MKLETNLVLNFYQNRVGNPQLRKFEKINNMKLERIKKNFFAKNDQAHV